MNNKEAIRRIKDHFRVHDDGRPTPYLDEAVMLAIEALERATPKKPIGDLHSVPHYRCPNCKKAVVVFENEAKFPYCHWCGQRIDWGNEDENKG